MSIQERIDLVGNVKAQARSWAREIDRLAAKMRGLNGMGVGGGRARGAGGASRGTSVSKEQRAQASALREQAKAQAAIVRQERASGKAAAATARAQAKMPQYGPGRREAGASAAYRQKSEAQAAKSAARAQASAAKEKARAEASAAKASKKAANDNARARKGDYRYTLKRTETGGMGGAINSFAGNAASNIASSAASYAADAAITMARTFIDAQKFREQSIAGLTILEGSGAAAKKTWDESFKLARETGSTQQQAMSSIQSMMASGFKKSDAVEMYKLMNAISVVNPQANLEGIARAISQIKNTGKLQGDELLQLADAGVSVDQVYKALGKRLGKTREEIIAMQAAGDIKADDAIAAIKDAMKTSVGGDVDKVLAGKANSLSAILGQLAASPMTFFSGMEQDPALADKMKNSLKGLVDLLDPSTEKGKKMADSFSKMVDVIAGPGADLFTKMVEGAPEFLATMTQLGTDMGPLVSLLGSIAGATMWFAGGVGILSEKLRSIDFSLMWGWLPSLISWIGEAASAMSTGGSTMASNLISGITNGIFGGASSVVSAIVSMAQTAIGAGNAAFAIRSPSKVFAAMGEQLPAGLGRGIKSNMAVVERDAAAMAGGATSSAQSALPFVGDAMAERGMGRQTTNNFGGIRFNAGGFNVGGPSQANPSDIAQDINRLIAQGVQNFMNKAAEAA